MDENNNTSDRVGNWPIYTCKKITITNKAAAMDLRVAPGKQYIGDHDITVAIDKNILKKALKDLLAETDETVNAAEIKEEK